MCVHFCYKMMHCGISVQCIVEFVRWVYCNGITSVALFLGHRWLQVGGQPQSTLVTLRGLLCFVTTTSMSLSPSTCTWNMLARFWNSSFLAALAIRQLTIEDRTHIRISTPASPRATRMKMSFSSFWYVCPSVVWFTRPRRNSWMLTTDTTRDTIENAVKHMICGQESTAKWGRGFK